METDEGGCFVSMIEQQPCCEQYAADKQKILDDPTTNKLKEEYKNKVVRSRTLIGSAFSATRSDPYRVAVMIHNNLLSFDPLEIAIHNGEPPFSTTVIERLNPGQTFRMNQKCVRKLIQEELCILSDGSSVVEIAEVLDSTGTGDC